MQSTTPVSRKVLSPDAYESALLPSWGGGTRLRVRGIKVGVTADDATLAVLAEVLIALDTIVTNVCWVHGKHLYSGLGRVAEVFLATPDVLEGIYGRCLPRPRAASIKRVTGSSAGTSIAGGM